MKTNLIGGMLACLIAIGCMTSMGGSKTDDAGAATDPLNATYIVEDQTIRLIDGRSETDSAPGSATKVITSVFGKPVYGNIDGKGDVDAALILTHRSRGQRNLLLCCRGARAQRDFIVVPVQFCLAIG